MEILSIQGMRMRSLVESDLNQVMALTARDEIVLRVREPPSQTEKEIRVSLRKPASR